MRSVNPSPAPSREAILHYNTPDYVVLKPGDHVLCAVSRKVIPLHRLTYWNVELQEAYASAELMIQRWKEARDRS